MKGIPIEDIKKQFGPVDDELMHEAELLIILFNTWPEVQKKILKKSGLKLKQVNQALKVSDLYAKKKIKLMNERLPKNRKEVIIIENDVMESLYEGRILKTNDKKSINKWLKKQYPTDLIITSEIIEKLEDAINLQGRSIDYLIIKENKIIAYNIEVLK